MITNAILSFFNGAVGILLAPLTIVDVVIDIATSIPIVTNFITFVVYIIPWTNLVPLLVISFSLLGLRIGIAVVKFIKGFIPTLGG